MFQLLTLRLRCLEALLPESGQGKITAPLFQGGKSTVYPKNYGISDAAGW